MRLGVLLSVGFALPAAALTPPLPCSPVTEADMTIYNVQILGNGTSGVTVEGYANATTLRDTIYERRPGPVAALTDFSGSRVTFCETGDFVAIPGVSPASVNDSLSATEFLRAQVKADKRLRFADVKKAAKAVYDDVIVLRETEQTCACSIYFPDLKPAAMTGFSDRANVEQ